MFYPFRRYSVLLASFALLCAPLQVQAQADFTGGASQAAPLPPDVIKTNLKTNYVNVVWSNVNNNDITEYHLYRLENYSPDATLKIIATIPHTAATTKNAVVGYDDHTVQPQRKYTYFVTSKDRFGSQSKNSKMSSVATPDKFIMPH